MKSKKAQAVPIIMVILGIALVAIMGVAVYGIFMKPTTESVVQTGIASQIGQATSQGDVAQIKVYVRDIAQDDVNTKKAVPIYCIDSEGQFVIDGTTSSTTAETSGSTTRGNTITCYAFNSTFQTLNPTVVNVDEEIEHIVIEGYTIATAGLYEFYDSTLTLANGGASNISISGEGSDSYDKLKFKNNNTNQWLPLGGFYFNVITGTNVSDLDISGTATVKGKTHGASTSIVESDLATKVTARKDNWDYVFEIDDSEYSATGNAGNNPIILEENDYLETRTVDVESTVGGVTGTESDIITARYFTKGYYRASKSQEIQYGHETDASASAVITADDNGGWFYLDA